jgi:hypothetical protein
VSIQPTLAHANATIAHTTHTTHTTHRSTWHIRLLGVAVVARAHVGAANDDLSAGRLAVGIVLGHVVHGHELDLCWLIWHV